MDINICVAFQCSFITCGCVSKAINRKVQAHQRALAFICIWILVCIYYQFFSNFIILLSENFINFHKSGWETVTYLMELLNNSNISTMSRIFIYLSLLILQMSGNQLWRWHCGLWNSKPTWHFSAPSTKKWDHTFEGMGTRPDTQQKLKAKPNLPYPSFCIFFLCIKFPHLHMHIIFHLFGGVTCFRITLNFSTPKKSALKT